MFTNEALSQEHQPRTIGSVERLDPALDALIADAPRLEVLGEGLQWAEGPVWIRDGQFLLCSDTRTNVIWRWDAKQGLRPFLKPAGYTGAPPRGGEMGSNGLALDKQGRLLLCQHGDRRVARLESRWDEPPRYASIADRYEGKRFNSPNDLAVHSSGAVYFTDPPYGLEKNIDDPAKELPFQGVFRVAPDGRVTLLTQEMERPNGIAFSPDEKTLYVANSGSQRPMIMAFPVKPDGSLGEGRVLLRAGDIPGRRRGSFDGMTVDDRGNIFTTGPGGVLVLTPEGKHLGTLVTTHPTANCTFGEDGRTLFIAAGSSLLRVRLTTKGAGF
jgi:gluconolactonase